MQTAQAMVESDLRGVSHKRLDDRDESLRAVFSTLKRSFLFQRLLGQVTVDKTSISKGYRTSSSWLSRVTVSGLDYQQANDTEQEVSSMDENVAVSWWKQEDGTYLIEIT